MVREVGLGQVFLRQIIAETLFHRRLVLRVRHQHVLEDQRRIVEVGARLGPDVEAEWIDYAGVRPDFFQPAFDPPLVDLLVRHHHIGLDDRPTVSQQTPRELRRHLADAELLRQQPVHVGAIRRSGLTGRGGLLVARVALHELIVREERLDDADDEALDRPPA